MKRARRVLASLGVMCFALCAGMPSAHAIADYTSFFWQRDLEGAGWKACEEPVTWSIDVRGLTSRQAQREIKRFEQTWAIWSESSGIPARFTGTESLSFDLGTNGLRRSDGSPQPFRHVYIAMKSGRQVPIMTRGVVGLAMPSVVLLPEREVVAGMVILRRGYILEQRIDDPEHVLHVYLHELGHVLGLGHAGKQTNIMYPTLDHLTSLGPGDIAGVKAFAQPCTPRRSGTPVIVTDWQE